jgi:antitoxin (DNA-binding transcriptional repressor) of toxin-antitoxin stability system
MIVTKTEFETNPSHYLDLVSQEEVVIINEGEYIAKLTGAKTSIVDSLVGLIPSSVTDAEVRRERLKKHEHSL